MGKQVQCKKCNQAFESSSKSEDINAIRHSNCGGHVRELTPDEFKKFSELPKDKPVEVVSPGKVDEDQIVLEEIKDLQIVPQEQFIPQTKPSEKTDSSLGAGSILVMNAVFAITGKIPLSDIEKDNLRNNANRLAEKYPSSVGKLKGGTELEFAESVVSPILNRYKIDTKVLKEVKKEEISDGKQEVLPN